MQLIVDAMRTFRGHPRVQRAASFALAQLVHDRADCVEDIASAGGVVEVLETMQAAPQDAELQAQCLGVLASPALAKDSVVRIEGDLFARVVCAALRLHRDQARLQALGCLALANLAIKSDRFAAMLTQQHHAHLLVMEAVQHHARSRPSGSRPAAPRPPRRRSWRPRPRRPGETRASQPRAFGRSWPWRERAQTGRTPTCGRRSRPRAACNSRWPSWPRSLATAP